jgi:Sulfotransferase family
VTSANVSPSGSGRAAPQVRVLYVGGAGRSGSTLLDLLLNEVPGLFAAGELKYIWTRGIANNELCGCGERFLKCPFWTAVGQQAYGGWSHVDAEEMNELERAVDTHARIPAMLKPEMWPGYAAPFARFVDVLERLYAAIAHVSGAAAIVDSTKRPSTAFLLARMPAIDLRFVQLVRDSRGVAFSWSKHVKRPEVTDSVDFMPRYNPVKAGVRWMGNNSLFHLLAALGVPGMRVRYESLIRAPRPELERVVRHAGLRLEPDALAFLDRRPLELETNHIVAGNPLRLEGKSLELRLDDAWHISMDRRQELVVLLLTWPLLLRYGYLGRRGAPPALADGAPAPTPARREP